MGSDIRDSEPQADEKPHQSDQDPAHEADLGSAASADQEGSHAAMEEQLSNHQMPDDDDLPHLSDEIITLIEDVGIFVQTEVAYRRATAAFVVDRVKAAAISGIVAAVIAIFALFALIVGLILGLSPLITPWGATAVVVGVMVIAALILVRRAMGAVGEITKTLAKRGDSAAQSASDERSDAQAADETAKE